MRIPTDGNVRTEINFLRLMNRCEHLVRDKSGSYDWRLEKYVDALTEFLSQLKKISANQPRHEDLIDYTRRVDFLKGLMEADKLSNTAEKAVAVDQLVPCKNHQETLSTEQNSGLQGVNIGRQLHAETKAKCLNDMRDELMRTSTNSSTRQRKVQIPGEDVSVVMKHHQQMQEKLADEMVYLARNLKENATLAGRIVREDKEKLQYSTSQADDNFSRLKVESERLEYHVQRVCSWWIWIMLVVVIVTFIWMVVFMRLHPKGT